MFGMKPIPPLDHYIPQTITKVVPPFDYQLDVYIYIPYKSKTEVFLGFAQIPGVYTQNPRFSKTW